MVLLTQTAEVNGHSLPWRHVFLALPCILMLSCISSFQQLVTLRARQLGPQQT